jgi:cytochrome d ubiquinol oxidase subunit II
LFIGGAVPPLIFGVAFGNLLQGVPFQFDENLVSTYSGSFWQLLNPFALLAGVVSSAMITAHGAVYLAHRTEAEIHVRSVRAAQVALAVLLVAFTLAGAWLVYGIEGYVITSAIDPAALPNPTAKVVERATGAWLANYQRAPLTMLLPTMVYVAAALTVVALARGRTGLAFISSSLVLVGVIGTAGAAMFPFIMPSSSHPASSLTVWDSVSSHLTLGIMFWATLIFMPLIIAYTSWAYRVMSGKVTAAYVREHEHSAY